MCSSRAKILKARRNPCNIKNNEKTIIDGPLKYINTQSALLADVLPRQLSFKHTVQLWSAWSQQTQAVDIQASEGVLFALIAQKIVGNRPGRMEPRAVKRRPKAFPLLMENRELARDKIRVHGHPKKKLYA